MSGRAIGPAAVLAAMTLFGCAKQVETGPPLPDAAGTAGTLRAGTGPASPYRLRFDWQYADEQGRLRGEGVVRYNPRDSVRLDLFAPGDASLSVSLTRSGLRSLGEIDDVTLPEPPFLYAMAGIFRPGRETPTRGFSDGETEVLVFEGEGPSLYVFLEGGRLAGAEERSGRRVLRRIRLDWSDGEWPRSAEFRDFVETRRVRWDLTEVRGLEAKHAPEIYDLPHPI